MVEVIRATPGVRKAWLYGSLVKQLFHPGSDIDIAVEGLDFERRDDLRMALERCTSFRVDVRDVDNPPEFRQVIECYGELLHGQS